MMERVGYLLFNEDDGRVVRFGACGLEHFVLQAAWFGGFDVLGERLDRRDHLTAG